jgi:hypothetical protein
MNARMVVWSLLGCLILATAARVVWEIYRLRQFGANAGFVLALLTLFLLLSAQVVLKAKGEVDAAAGRKPSRWITSARLKLVWAFRVAALTTLVLCLYGARRELKEIGASTAYVWKVLLTRSQ